MSATFLITAPTFHRKRVFQNQRFGELLTEMSMRYRQECNLLLHDYVIMPDHVHLLVTARADMDLATVVKSLQHAFADEVTRQYGYSGEVWEPDFSSREIHTAEEYAEAVRHIHSNPVRSGFCDNVGEYRMSSKSSRWVLDPLPEPLRPAQLPA